MALAVGLWPTASGPQPQRAMALAVGLWPTASGPQPPPRAAQHRPRPAAGNRANPPSVLVPTAVDTRPTNSRAQEGTAMTIDANQPPTGSSVGNVVRRVAGAHIGRVPIGGLVAAVAVATLLGTAYYLGNPSVAGSGGLGSNQRALSAEGAPAIGSPVFRPDLDGAFKAAFPALDSVGSTVASRVTATPARPADGRHSRRRRSSRPARWPSRSPT
jgi:hypothetical protein